MSKLFSRFKWVTTRVKCQCKVSILYLTPLLYVIYIKSGPYFTPRKQMNYFHLLIFRCSWTRFILLNFKPTWLTWLMT